MATSTTHESKIQIPLSVEDQADVEQAYQALKKHKASLIGPEGERHLPKSLHAFLLELVGLLAEGQSVYIVQKQAKLTTVEAAAMLGVSRQFLVSLLETGAIPYHKVGTHRRMYAKDLLKYKTERDSKRRKVIRDLARREAAEGLYDRKPSVDADQSL